MIKFKENIDKYTNAIIEINEELQIIGNKEVAVELIEELEIYISNLSKIIKEFKDE